MNKKQKKMLTRIVIAAAMLIALHFLPVTGLVRLALYLAAYLVIGEFPDGDCDGRRVCVGDL